MGKTFVAGVGMTEFIKPRDLRPYEDMGLEAAVKALVDAGINYDEVQYALAGFCYGDSCSGQRVIYQLGMTGIPILNVNNNCSTGSTALHQGRTLVAAGLADCVLCVGFEKMEPGSLGSKWGDRTSPVSQLGRMMFEQNEPSNSPITCQLFGNAGIEYCDKHNGGKYDSMPIIGEANHRHSGNNPYSQFRQAYSLEQIKGSPIMHGPLTKLQCCPTSDGAAAAIVVSERFLNSHPNLKNQAVEIAGQSLVTDTPKTFNKSAVDLIGFDMSKKAAELAYKEAGITAKDVQVVELHDCFSANELITADALGLSEPGKACQLFENGDHTYGGKYVINPSGGLISKGHPLGATGLAQCAELTWHLRGWATNRSVPNTRYALQHNIGLGGAVVVSVFKKPAEASGPDGRDRIGYNPAIEAHPITKEDFNKVKSVNASSDYMLVGSDMFKDANL